MSVKPREILTKEFLDREYIKLGKSSEVIAKWCGCSATTVRYALKKHGIPIDNDTQRGRRGQPGKNRKGFKEISGTYWYNIQFGARRRGLPFDITIEYAWKQFIKQRRRCALSGVEIVFSELWDGPNLTLSQTASLDRRDHKKGYVSGNIQWVHKEVNRLKMAYSETDLIKWCKLISAWSETKL